MYLEIHICVCVCVYHINFKKEDMNLKERKLRYMGCFGGEN